MTKHGLPNCRGAVSSRSAGPMRHKFLNDLVTANIDACRVAVAPSSPGC